MSNVEPFPVRRCLHYLDMVRCTIEAQPASKRQAFARDMIERHRQFLTECGVAKGLIDREVRSLQAAILAPPTPKGGMRLAV